MERLVSLAPLGVAFVSEGRGLTSFRTIRLCTRLLRLSAAIVLIFGARYTWVIPLLCHVIFLSVACMFCA